MKSDQKFEIDKLKPRPIGRMLTACSDSTDTITITAGDIYHQTDTNKIDNLVQ